MTNGSFPTTPWPQGQIQAILFDLDGTLINSDDRSVASLSKILHPLLGKRSQRAARWLIMKAEYPGNAAITLLDRVGLDGPVMRYLDHRHLRRASVSDQPFTLVRGAEELTLALKSQGYRLGIVTTRTRYHIDRLFAQFPAFDSGFDTSCGLQDTRRLKPHPSPILLAAEQLGVAADNCLMVGDTVMDIVAAKKAGAWSTGVLCGFGERQELERAGADVILSHTSDLLGLFDSG